MIRTRAASEAFRKLLEFLWILQGDNGCPWDRSQVVVTTIPLVATELSELQDALAGSDPDAVTDELSDVFMMVLFMLVLFERDEGISTARVLAGAETKLRRRLAEVLSSNEPMTARTAKAAWNKAKEEEEHQPSDNRMNSQADVCPLDEASRIQEGASMLGLDWHVAEEAAAKLEEEIRELRTEIAANDASASEDEIGDLIFSAVNVARLIGGSASEALRRSTAKFARRCTSAAAELNDECGGNRDPGDWDRAWEAAKRKERDLSESD